MRAILLASLIVLLHGGICSAATVYRWTDSQGKVYYSDQPPPGDAKSVQEKKLGGNFIETDELPYATQVAMKRFPATLYVFDCGDPCTQARSLLRNRGVPATEINPSSQAGADKLKAVTGSLEVPVLQLGDLAPIKGYNADRWNAALSTAGYPVPSSLRTTPPPVPKKTAEEAKPQTAAANVENKAPAPAAESNSEQARK
jgi:glutaredoxin